MKFQFWLEQYHTTINKKNTGYTEVVDKVTAYENMLYYFIYLISSHQHISNDRQHTNKCSHQHHSFGWN